MYISSAIYITIGFGESSRIMKTFSLDSIVGNNLRKRINILETILRPALYAIPFFSLYIILFIPTVLLDLVVMAPSRVSPGSHLFSLAPVILIFACIDLLRRIHVNTRKRFLYYLLIGVIVSIPTWSRELKLKPNETAAAMNEAVAFVKDNGSVTASRILAYRLNHRHDFYLPENHKQTDYIVINKSFQDSKDNYIGANQYLHDVSVSDKYVKVMDKDNILVYIKKYKINHLLHDDRIDFSNINDLAQRIINTEIR